MSISISVKVKVFVSLWGRIHCVMKHMQVWPHIVCMSDITGAQVLSQNPEKSFFYYFIVIKTHFKQKQWTQIKQNKKTTIKTHNRYIVYQHSNPIKTTSILKVIKP